MTDLLKPVDLTTRGGIATITLNRPAVLNAWDRKLGAALAAAVEQVAHDDSVRVVCVTGAGRAFSTGGDLSITQGPEDLDEFGVMDVYRILTTRFNKIMRTIRTMPKPVVAAVNGVAAGIGASLALSADLIIARDSAYFVLPFTTIGLTPDGGSSMFLAERVGFTRAAELALLGGRLDAVAAERWGLINRVTADEDFDPLVATTLEKLAAGATGAYAGVKHELNTWMYSRMDEQFELEAAIQRDRARSADFPEGIEAFLARRAPRFHN